MQLMLIRHGETDWNSTGRYLGQTDVPLNHRGKGQARDVSLRVKEFKPDYLYSSDLQRAQETARVLETNLSLPVQTDRRLREIDFGYWEGKTYHELSPEDKKVSNDWFSEPETVRLPGGEAFSTFKNRVLAFSKELLLTHQGEKVVVVTHGGPIRVLITHYFSMPTGYASRLQIEPATLNRIDFFGLLGFLRHLNA